MCDLLFNSVPNSLDADLLNEKVKYLMIDKISSILSQLSDQIDVDLSVEINKFNNFNNEGIINPSLFYYYFKLKSAIESQELDKILDVIILLSSDSITIRNTSKPLILSAFDSIWEQDVLTKNARKKIISEFGMKHGFEQVMPVFNEEINKQKTNILSAIEILSISDPKHYHVALNNLHSIKLFEGSIRGFSLQEAYGNIYIRTPRENDNDILYYLEHIIHECAHQNLFALQMIDPVVLNDNKDRYIAPIRKQLRPMDGIFHACFVLARMTRGFRIAEEYIDSPEYNKFYSRIEKWFRGSYQTVKENAVLSENGKALFSTFEECAYG